MTQEVTRYFDNTRAIIFHWNEGLRGKRLKEDAKERERERVREREIERERERVRERGGTKKKTNLMWSLEVATSVLLILAHCCSLDPCSQGINRMRNAE